jgi:hypothetical protein
MIHGRLVVAACNPILGELIDESKISLEPSVLFNLSQMGIEIDQSIVQDDDKLQFAANKVYEVELVDVEKVIGWMKNIGCENVVIGRGLRSTINQEQLAGMITKYGMKPVGPLSYGKLPDGVSILMQHTSSVNNRNPFTGSVSKTVVLKDSRPIEVQ